MRWGGALYRRLGFELVRTGVLLLCFCAIATISMTQTLVGVKIGNDLSRVRGVSYSVMFEEYPVNGFSVYSPTAGISLEQYLPYSFILSYDAMITRKTLDVRYSTFVYVSKYRFNYIRNTIQLKKELFNKYRFGVGYGLNFLGAIYYGVNTRDNGYVYVSSSTFETNDYREFDEHAYVISLGYRYRTFILDLTYTGGISQTYLRQPDFKRFEPIHNINLSLAWHYNIPWKQKAKPLPCP